jgi:hypothetical protein
MSTDAPPDNPYIAAGTETLNAESLDGVTVLVATVAPEVNVTTPAVAPNLEPAKVNVDATPA